MWGFRCFFFNYYYLKGEYEIQVQKTVVVELVFS